MSYRTSHEHVGLYIKIETGQITVDQATVISEDKRIALIQQRMAEQDRDKKKL